MPDLDTHLAALDHHQLVEIIHRFVTHDPDLEELVYLPLASEQRPVDTRRLAGKVEWILDTMGNDWRASLRAERMLRPLVQLGRDYLHRDRLAAARDVFSTIARTIQDRYERIRDEESEVARIVSECAEGLGACLEKHERPEVRESFLADLFDLYAWDALKHGGYGMARAPRAVLLERTTPGERAMIAEWTRAALSATRSVYYRQNGARLLVDLLPEAERDAPTLERVYAAGGLYVERLDLYLAQERLDDIDALLREAPDSELFGLTRKLENAGRSELAVEVLGDHWCLLVPKNHWARSWLSKQGAALPNQIEELVEAVRRFQANATIGHLKGLKELATEAGWWSQALEVIDCLPPGPKKYRPLRARIHAERGRVAEALTELAELSSSTWRSAALDIAGSLEHTHPSAARELYLRLVDHHLAHGTPAARKKAAALQRRLEALELA